MSYSFFCPCPRGLEIALAEELHEIAAQSPTLKVHNSVPGGVHCSGTLQDAMRLNLHSRIGSRVLLRIAQSGYVNENDVYDLALGATWEDWFDLEKPIQRDLYVDLPPAARKQYRDMEKTLLADIEGHQIEAFNAGARTMKCRQMAAGACYIGDVHAPGERKWVESHTAKLDALEEIIEECAGAPILVAYNFKSDLARLLKRFKQARLLDQKSSTIKEWNAGKIPLLLTHPESAGHGLNLQYGGNILVYFSFDWKVEPYLQIAERVGPVRQAQAGFKRNVYIYRIVARNTVDEDVLKVIENNVAIQDVLMDSLRRRLAT